MAVTSAILPLKQRPHEYIGPVYGAASGATDTTIWAVSKQYPDWGIFYN